MNELTSNDVYEIEVRVEARPETVFAFFTDPARMVQWKGVDALLDARPGGVYRVNVTGRETVIGEYVEVTPPHRVVFTWGWDNGPILPGSTRVEVDLIPDGDATIVRLRHYRSRRRGAGVAPRGLGALPAAPGAGRFWSGRRRRPLGVAARMILRRPLQR